MALQLADGHTEVRNVQDEELTTDCVSMLLNMKGLYQHHLESAQSEILLSVMVYDISLSGI